VNDDSRLDLSDDVAAERFRGQFWGVFATEGDPAPLAMLRDKTIAEEIAGNFACETVVLPVKVDGEWRNE
jgi:hypothetical protein